MKIQKKPYEISLWTTTSDTEGNLIEKKLGIIGSSNNEDSPFRAFDPHLIENINGSKTLTFSIFWRWYNPEIQEFESNPWEKYLVNERRVKLKYDGEWYEFVIKEMEESKEEYKKTFTCVSAPILELSRNGYNVELDTTLYNNQGNIYELAQRILDDSDWIVDVEGSDKIYSYYTEHLYRARVEDGVTITVYNIKDPDERVTITENSQVYLFYSEVEEERLPFQLLYNWEPLRDENGNPIIDEDGWVIPGNVDSNNVIINEKIYIYYGDENLEIIDDPDDDEDVYIFDVEELPDLTYKAARLVLSQLGHYDPVLKAYVSDYELDEDSDGEPERKYGYIATEYVTSDVIGNLINNPKDYVLTKTKERLDSWTTYIENWYAAPGAYLAQATYPPITKLGSIDTGVNINLQTDPTNSPTALMVWKLDGTDEYIYNTSVKENLNYLPNGVIKGNKYVFRIKCCLLKDNYVEDQGTGVLTFLKGPKDRTSSGTPYWATLANTQLKVQLTLNNNSVMGKATPQSSKKLVEQKVQRFERVEGTVGVTNPYKKGWYEYIGTNGKTADDEGHINFDKTNDTIINEGKVYYKRIDGKTETPYYYGIIVAPRSYSKEELNSSSLQIKFKWETPPGGNYYLLVEDVEFFPYIEDEKYEPMTWDPRGFKFFMPPGSPLISETVQSLKIFDQHDNINNAYETQYKWEAEFTDLDNIEPYTPVYNDYLATSSISGAQSNYYNLIQDLCEKFQCWADFQINHNKQGYIIPYEEEYYLSPDISANPGTTYYTKVQEGVYEVVTVVDGEEYDPTNPNNYYNPQVLGWYEHKKTGKKVVFKEFIGKENYAGFRYGINLSSISRSLDSNAFVSKMIVANNEVEGIQTGVCSIERAQDNPTGLSWIYDFTYYVNQQLLDGDTLNQDLYIDNEDSEESESSYIGFYPRMKRLTTEYQSLVDDWNLAANEMITYGARKQTYEAEMNAAKDAQADAWEDMCAFVRNASGFLSYNEYTDVKPSDDDAFTRVSEFVKKYWDKDPEHNSTIDYWLKYVNASDVLGRSTTQFEEASEYYDRAKVTYDELTQEMRRLQGEINKLTKEFNTKYSDFLQEGTWNDQDAKKDDLYYYDAVNVLRTSAQPQVSYQINVIELSELEGYEPYTFAIGDKTYIEDTEFFGWAANGSPYREEVVVNQIDWSLDDPSTNQITVQNYRTQFEDLFQRLSASVQQAELNANAYNRAAQIIQPSGKIDQGALQKTLNQDSNKIEMGFGTGTITQNSEGILIEGLGVDKKNKLKITGKGIFISKDNGDTWTPVLRGQGTNASTLTDGSLDVSNINIIDGSAPTFQWNGDGLTAYGFNDVSYSQTNPTDSPFDEGLWEEAEYEEISIGTITYGGEEDSDN